jgi:hypothetical protein
MTGNRRWRTGNRRKTSTSQLFEAASGQPAPLEEDLGFEPNNTPFCTHCTSVALRSQLAMPTKVTTNWSCVQMAFALLSRGQYCYFFVTKSTQAPETSKA